MAFKLVKRDRMLVPVKGHFVDAEGGKERFDCKLVCNRIPQSEVDAYVKSFADTQVERQSAIEFMRDKVTGWQSVQDAEGVDVPFGSDALDEFLETPGVALLAHTAYFDSLGAKAKN